MDNLILLAVIVAGIIAAKLISYIGRQAYLIATCIFDSRRSEARVLAALEDDVCAFNADLRRASSEATLPLTGPGVAATWKITTPDGQRIITSSLREFGERMGWNIASMKAGAAGRRKYRGHNFERLS